MRRSLHAILAACFLGGATLPAAAQQSHVALLPDLSGSFKGVVDTQFAARVARDVEQRLPSMKMRDVITILPLGEYGTRNLSQEVQVTKRFPSARARKTISAMIAGLPGAVENKLGGVQKATYILGTLDKLSRRMNCATHAGHVFVLSDGQETGQALTLPKHPLFKGCASFTIIGVQHETPEKTRRLGEFWMNWCEAAGFARCDWLS